MVSVHTASGGDQARNKCMCVGPAVSDGPGPLLLFVTKLVDAFNDFNALSVTEDPTVRTYDVCHIIHAKHVV